MHIWPRRLTASLWHNNMNKITTIILVLITISIAHNSYSEESEYFKKQIIYYTRISEIGQFVCVAGLGIVGYGIYKMHSSPKKTPMYNPLDTNQITGYMTLDNPKYAGRNIIIAGVITAIGGTYLIVDSAIKIKKLHRIKVTTSNNGIQFTYLF
jgi:hypothetical protein